MNPTLTVNTTQMEAALREYMKTSRHSIAFVLNRKLFHIARRAYDLTPVAKRDSILRTFNVEQTERVVAKGRHAGKIRRKTNYSGLNQSAFRIMNWKRKKSGKATLRGAEALRATKAMVASRLRAVGSLKSGWVGAIVRLKNILNETFLPPFKNRLNNPGTALPARPGPNPVSEVQYRLAINKRLSAKIDPRVVDALQKAFNAEAADTWRHLTAKLQLDANKVNAK